LFFSLRGALCERVVDLFVDETRFLRRQNPLFVNERERSRTTLLSFRRKMMVFPERKEGLLLLLLLALV